MQESGTMRPKKSRIVGIDFGIARIGLSLSDESKIIASPLATIACEKKSESTAAKVMNELKKHQELHRYDIEKIIIGLPLMMSGKMGFLADETKHFVELLSQLTTIPIIMWDERLTTVQAERSMREGNMSRKKRSKVVDVIAAVIILQNYLDHMTMQTGI